MLELPLWAIAPLLHAISKPDARLIVGGAQIGHWTELNPVVIDPEGNPLWVGSNTVVVNAAKNGLIKAQSIGKRLSTFVLTPEGKALERDLTASMVGWKEKAKRLEEELKDVLDGIDDAYEATAELIPGLVGASTIQSTVFAMLKAAMPRFVSKQALIEAIGLATNNGVRKGTLTDALRQLRNRGWQFTHDRTLGYRLDSMERVKGAEIKQYTPPPVKIIPPETEMRTCNHCHQSKWLGEFKWHGASGSWRHVCKDCLNAAERARRKGLSPLALTA